MAAGSGRGGRRGRRRGGVVGRIELERAMGRLGWLECENWIFRCFYPIFIVLIVGILQRLVVISRCYCMGVRGHVE